MNAKQGINEYQALGMESKYLREKGMGNYRIVS